LSGAGIGSGFVANQADRLLEHALSRTDFRRTLNREGIATPVDVIEHITPLGWQHISLTGNDIWPPTDSLDLRPLRRETSMLAAWRARRRVCRRQQVSRFALR
jgi:hypothetical protein